ncbi:hypothetical protein GGQ68_001017 [Sagittula marina]|uniref:Uncharacterized protein n=1 Tax=Sagittula marina TaxID=943940 RepID=A0A7W6DND8_9RHOB|nr:hypothetical protein [Sagittula marina]MBB3984701.1 hypothetical protein [Sagittula marina]
MRARLHKRLLGTVLQGAVLLGCASPTLAQDNVDIPLDLQAIPEGTGDDTNWSDVTDTRPVRFEFGLGLRRETMGGPLDSLVDDAGALSFASLAVDIDTQMGAGFDFLGRGVAHFEEGETDLLLQRAVLSFAPQGSRLRASLGKEYFAHSFTELAHVLDLSPREAARIDTDDTREDYAYPFARLGFDVGAHHLSLIAMSQGHDLTHAEDDPWLYALRYETQRGEANLSAQVIHRDDADTEFGFGINAPVGVAILSFEGTVSDRRRLPMTDLRPGGGELRATGADTPTYQTVLAARVPVSSKWQAEAAYLYNGHGYSDAEWRDFRSAEDAVLAGLRVGNFRYADFLGDAQEAHADQYLRRNYVTFALSSLEEIGQWSATAGAVGGLDDGSAFGFAEASRPIGTAGRFSVSMSGGSGSRDSEFVRRSAEVEMKLVWGF